MDHHRNLTMLIEGDFQQFFNMLENSHNGSLSRERERAINHTSASTMTSTSPKLSICALAVRKLK